MKLILSEEGGKILLRMDLNFTSTKFWEMIFNVRSVFEILVNVFLKIIIYFETNTKM